MNETIPSSMNLKNKLLQPIAISARDRVLGKREGSLYLIWLSSRHIGNWHNNKDASAWGWDCEGTRNLQGIANHDDADNYEITFCNWNIK